MTDTTIRVMTAAAVLLVAAIAAVVSFVHIEHLAITHGQTLLAALLLPVSIDGTVVAASMVMLRAARAGMRTPWLARVMLAASVAATLAANLAHGARFGVTGSLLSGWPAAAFIGSAEMALGMVRRATRKTTRPVASGATDRATAAAARRPANRGADAAAAATRKAIAEGHPVPSARALARDHRISRDTAARVLATIQAGADGHNRPPAQLTRT